MRPMLPPRLLRKMLPPPSRPLTLPLPPASSASNAASAAQSTASQALQAAQGAQACCDATNEKIDRAFQKSMGK